MTQSMPRSVREALATYDILRRLGFETVEIVLEPSDNPEDPVHILLTLPQGEYRIEVCRQGVGRADFIAAWETYGTIFNGLSDSERTQISAATTAWSSAAALTVDLQARGIYRGGFIG